MSLLLEALKKAEAKQGAARGAAENAAPTASHAAPLALTALEATPADRIPNTTQAAPNFQTHAQTLSQTRQQQAHALFQRGGVRVSGRFDRLAESLTFPVVVGIVLVVGAIWGGWVLYRSATYMPSAVVGAVTSPAQTQPSSTANLPSNTVLTAPHSVSPEQARQGAPSEHNETIGATARARVTASDAQTALPTATRHQAAGSSVRPLALNRSERSNQGLSDSLAAGYQALQQGDRASAANHYQRALQLDANNLDALLGLGYLAQQSGVLERAEQYYKHALQIDPRDPYALSALASLPMQSGQNDSASFERRLKNQAGQRGDQNTDRNVDSATVQFALGNTFAAQQRWDDAQQAYFKAAAGEPRNPNYLFNLAVSLDQLHQSKLALEYYRKALTLVANNTVSAPAQFSREQVQQRVNALEHALTITPGQP